MVSVSIDSSNCVGCGICEEVCPREVFEISKTEKSSKEKVSKVKNEKGCLMCMACVSACAENCIEISEPSPEMIL